MYAIINSTTKKISKNYAVVDGATRKVAAIYGVIDGVTKLIWKEDAISYPFTGIVVFNKTTKYIMRTTYNNGTFSDFENFSPYAMNDSLLYATFGKNSLYGVHSNNDTLATSSNPWMITINYYDKNTDKIKCGFAWEMYTSFNPPAYRAGILPPNYGYITDDNHFLTLMGLYKPDRSLMEPSDTPCTMYTETYQIALALFEISESLYMPQLVLKSLYSINNYRNTSSYWGDVQNMIDYKYRAILTGIEASWGDGIVAIRTNVYNSDRKDMFLLYTIDENDVISCKNPQGYSVGDYTHYMKCFGQYALSSFDIEDDDDTKYFSNLYYATEGTTKFTILLNLPVSYSTLYRDIYYDVYTNLLLCITGTTIYAYKIENSTLTLLTSYYAGNAYLTNIFGVTRGGIIGCITSSSMRNVKLFQMIYDGENCVITSSSDSDTLPTNLISQYLLNQPMAMTFYDPDNM